MRASRRRRASLAAAKRARPRSPMPPRRAQHKKQEVKDFNLDPSKTVYSMAPAKPMLPHKEQCGEAWPEKAYKPRGGNVTEFKSKNKRKGRRKKRREGKSKCRK